MTNEFGQSIESAMGLNQRFLYSLRRTDQGDLYFNRVDQMSNADSITINAPGDENNDYTGFASGVDFLEGRDVNHNLVYANLNYEQMRWDDRSIYYYMDSAGELVARINQKYPYTGYDNT